MKRLAALLCVGMLATPVSAHDLITAESAQAYLATAAELQQAIQSKEPPGTRAQAHVDLGKLLDEIRELLNGDLDAHGRVLGLASNFLMSELSARRTALSYSVETNRFLANLYHYREALKLGPAGPVAADAGFRLLQGYFYDSFTIDPLQPRSQTAAQLAGQIRLAEDFLKKYPQHAGREEASFILAIHYVQAARAAKPGKEQAEFAQKARSLAADFVKTWPDSMRSSALPHLLDGLPAQR